ncbi:MAG: DUF547 domain-containing protein [Thermoflavifilum sp.]|nr:DUF547 domain-containing protein [Thermoflavifilum sp.]
MSQRLLYAVRTGDSIQAYLDTLAHADDGVLASQLDDDAHKKAFWLNIYNAFVQILLQRDTSLYHHRGKFFRSLQIHVAGYSLSLDEIEHGLLRRSAIKWSLGYLHKLFPSSFEKRFRVDTLDYRIHFALNCGAKSCPPIAFYDPGHIDMQLNLAMRNYLFNELTVDSIHHVLYLPAIMGWFRHDFGGKKKMVELVKQLGLIAADAHPRVKFKSYDWSLYLNHYKNDK